MNKSVIFTSLFIFIVFASFSQAPKKVLYIIDSIPMLNDPEDWNQVQDEDIAEVNVISQKDSLMALGWEQMENVIYIFTREYAIRPDSIRKIPGLRQMVLKNGVWNLNNSPYSGKYIDYYNNGKKQNTGTLTDGKIDGELIVYHKNGNIKSVTNYYKGIRQGVWKEYYKNGAIMREDDYVYGTSKRTGKLYFINGQIMQELRLKNETSFDTSIAYYSTGKIKQFRTTRTGEFPPNRKEADMNYNTTMFYQNIRAGNMKDANKHFFNIWKIDSASADTYFKEGLLLATQFHFDDAILKFDRALTIEPMMHEALEQRALARIKRFKFGDEKFPLPNSKNSPLILEDIMTMPEDEEAGVCRDLLLADDLDKGVNYNNRLVPEAIISYCRKKKKG